MDIEINGRRWSIESATAEMEAPTELKWVENWKRAEEAGIENFTIKEAVKIFAALANLSIFPSLLNWTTGWFADIKTKNGSSPSNEEIEAALQILLDEKTVLDGKFNLPGAINIFANKEDNGNWRFSAFTLVEPKNDRNHDRIRLNWNLVLLDYPNSQQSV